MNFTLSQHLAAAVCSVLLLSSVVSAEEVLERSAEASALVAGSFIDQALTNLTSDAGMEGDLSQWNGGVKAETTVVAEGLQSVKIDGAHFYKTYDCNLMPASENTYYQLSLQAAVDSVTVSPSVSFVFYAADRETKLGGTATVLDLEGTAPYREFPSPD